MGWKVRRPAVTAAFLDGDGHPATSELEVNKLGDRHLVLSEHVVADNTELGLAVGDINRHIPIANEQSPGSAAAGRHHQLAVVRVKNR